MRVAERSVLAVDLVEDDGERVDVALLAAERFRLLVAHKLGRRPQQTWQHHKYVCTVTSSFDIICAYWRRDSSVIC